jgi:hypothetical protein
MDDDEAPCLRPDGRFYMTPDGHTQLKDELAQLMKVDRPRVVEIVSWAAANGDRSENEERFSLGGAAPRPVRGGLCCWEPRR